MNYRAIEIESDSRFILIPNGYSVTIFEYSLLSRCYLAVASQSKWQSAHLDLLKFAKKKKKKCDERFSEVKCASNLLHAGLGSKFVLLRTGDS